LAGRLKLRHLQFMLALADTGSMAGTAQRLSVSYPAVVKTRLEIEDIVGARLLSGRGNATSLTEIGACLADASLRILEQLDCTADEIAALRDGLNGHVVVGVRLLDALRWLAPAVTDFRAAFPGIAISLVDGLHENIVRGEVDLGLARAGPKRWDGQLAFKPLFPIRSVVVGSGSLARRQSGTPDWPALLAQPWCLPPTGTPLRDRFEEHLAAQGLQAPADVLVISDMSAELEMLRSGSYLALASEKVALELAERRIVQIITDPLSGLDDHITLIWRAEVPMHPAVRQFKRFLLQRET
jgi:DNA-binding transcriptional LysR family regulator